MVISRKPARMRDILIFDRVFQHGPGFHLADDSTLDFLPRRLAFRIFITANRFQRLAAFGQFLIGNQDIRRPAAKIDAHAVAGLENGKPPPAAASGEALRIDGEPDVPDWRPSPIQGSDVMPFFKR